MNIRKAFDGLKCFSEILAIVDIRIDSFLESLIADLLIREIYGCAVGGQHFANLPEATVAHQRAVALLVAAQGPLPWVLGH